MAVSLRSQAKQAETNDITVGLATLKGGVDEQGEYWLSPGSKEKIRCRNDAKAEANRIDSLILVNLEKGKHRSTLV